MKVKRKIKSVVVKRTVTTGNGYAKLYNKKTRLLGRMTKPETSSQNQDQDPQQEAGSPDVSPNGRQSRQRKRPLIFDPSDTREKRKYMKREILSPSPEKKPSKGVVLNIAQQNGNVKIKRQPVTNGNSSANRTSSAEADEKIVYGPPWPTSITHSEATFEHPSKKRPVGRPKKLVGQSNGGLKSGQSSNSLRRLPILVRQDIPPRSQSHQESKLDARGAESGDSEDHDVVSLDSSSDEADGNNKELGKIRKLFQDLVPCDCQATSFNEETFAGMPDTKEFCQALETREGELVGCGLQANPNNFLYRVSPQNTLSIFCNLHINRLRRHQSCPYCGKFCTTGSDTIRCTNKSLGLEEKQDKAENETTSNSETHLFHLSCASKVQQMIQHANGAISNWKSLTGFKCPHCGSEDMDNIRKVHLTVKTMSPPVSLPEQEFLPAAASISNGEEVVESHSHLNGSKSPAATPNEPLPELAYASVSTKISIAPPEECTKNLVDDAITDEFKEVMAKVQAMKPAENGGSPSDSHVINRILNAVKRRDLVEVFGLVVKHHYPIDKPFQTRENKTLVHLAVESGNMCFVFGTVLCSPDFSILDDNGLTPLMTAAKLNEPDIVKYLIASGSEEVQPSANGMNVLHIAVIHESFDSVREIVESYPMLINTKDEKEGLTPLMIAAKYGFTHIAKYLINSGRCDTLILDKKQNSAIHWVAYSGLVPVFNALPKSAIELVEAKNSDGDSAIDICFQRNQTDLMMAILQACPNVDISRVLAKDDTKDNRKDRTIILARMREVLETRDQILNNRKSKFTKIICDISNGKEGVRISCVNTEDEAELPKDFHYITELPLTQNLPQYPKSIFESRNSHNQVCPCNPAVERPEEASDSRLQDSAHAKIYNSFGRLFSYDTPREISIDPIYECNEMCHCNVKSCPNRVVQKGSQINLQVFRTNQSTLPKEGGKGWGVRTLSKIPLGGFICEYIGETLTQDQLGKLTDDSCVFYQPDLLPNQGIAFNSKYFGNVARFLNHSCYPNSVPIIVFTHHESFSPLPRIAFFATREIQPHEEITFNYGPTFWKVKTTREPDWKCLCGTRECPHAPTTEDDD